MTISGLWVETINFACGKAAKRLGRDPKELRHTLYQAYFAGDVSVLGIYDEAFGRGALKKISGLKDISYTSSQLSDLGSELGVEEAAFGPLWFYTVGGEVDIMEGFKVKQDNYVREDLIDYLRSDKDNVLEQV